MDTLVALLCLFMTAVVWIFYHKIFSVTYFGFNAILKELVVCFFIACVIVYMILSPLLNLFGITL